MSCEQKGGSCQGAGDNEALIVILYGVEGQHLGVRPSQIHQPFFARMLYNSKNNYLLNLHLHKEYD